MTFQTFNVPSFFAGVATVLALLTVGFGGGVMMSGVFSDSSRQPNKIERQATRETKESKPANAPVMAAVPAAASTAPVQTAPAPTQAANPPPASSGTQQAPDPQPTPQVQAAPQSEVPPSQAQQSTAQIPPSLGPEKPVALAQPTRGEQFDPSQLSRREQARYWRHQRRAERAQRREEHRKQFADRRQQEQVRREEMKTRSGRLRPQDADDDRDDDDRPTVVAPRERGFDAPPLFGGLFGGGR